MDIRISPLVLKRFLIGIVASLSLAGLAVELAAEMWPLEFADSPYDILHMLLSLSYESNLPTWYSSHIIIVCAALLALVSFAKTGHGVEFCGHWRGLAVVFAYLSLDEAIELHEGLNQLFDTGGFFFFGWVIPFGLLLIGLSIAYWKFLWELPEKTRRRFFVAGFVYVGGALGIELPLGYWTDLHGDQNLTYALIDWVEETMEMCGMSIFAWSLVSFLTGGGDGLQVRRMDVEITS